jgi:hypothetical protein
MAKLASTGAGSLEHGHSSGWARLGYFLRHLGEMLLAMLVGMMAGGAVLALVFSTVLASPTRGMMSMMELLDQVPVAVLAGLVLAASTTGTMVAWMRHRGHDWRSCGEMAGAMLVPLVPIMGLLWWQVIPGAVACCLYCASMIPATVVAMLFRLDLYTTGHAGDLAHAA